MLRAAIVIAVIVAVVLGLALVGRARQRTYARRAFDGLEAAALPQDAVVRHEALPADLPEVVRAWLVRAVPSGTPVPTRVTLEQEGLFRLKPGEAGAHLTAHQAYSVAPAAFVWSATIRVGGLPFYGLDALSEDAGLFSGRLLGLVQLVFGADLEVRRASMLRYLGEIVWLPQALAVTDAVRWEPVDARHARAFLTSGGETVTGVFEFDASSRPIAFTAERPRDVDGKSVLMPWRGEYRDFVRVHGVEVPGSAQVSWELPEGPFTYWEAAISGVRFIP